MPDLQFVILHDKYAYHYQRFTLFWRSIWKSERFLLDWCHICWLLSKTDNGLKWPKSCFKCFKLLTRSSLPISSQVMKIGPFFEPVRKVSNKIWATKHSRRQIIAKLYLSAKKVWYAIFFSGEGVAIKVPMEKGKKHHRKVLQRHSIGGAKKLLSETTPCPWF